MTFSLLNLASYRDIASSIAQRLAETRDRDPLGAWSEEVIVASNGVAQAISASLLEKLPNGFAALQLQSIETLATRIVNAAGEFPRIATDEERRLAMRTAARSLDDPLTSTRGAASMLERSYRDIRDSGLTLADFSRRLSGARSLRNRDRVKLALRAWQLYEKLIVKLGASDSADVLARAADLIRAGATVKPQIVAGFYDATGAQMAVLQALREVEKLVGVFVPAVDGEAFADSFIRSFAASGLGPRASGSPQLLVRQSVTREGEIRDICARVAALLKSQDPGPRTQDPASIGIVSRSLDAYDVTLFARFAAEHDFCVSECPSVPLVAHRFARAAVQLLRLRERNFPRADVLEIARSGIKLTTRPNLDKVDYETRRASVAGGRSADLRQRTFRSPVIDDYILIVEELESMTERVDSSWLPKLIQRMRAETVEDSAVIEELDKLAKLFQRADAWKRPFDQTSLLDALESASYPRTEDRGPRTVWLGDVMRLRGRSFQHLFAFRMQDDVMPQRRVEDPLLPDADRRLLGIREIGDGRAEEQLLFGLMSAAGDNVEFSFAASDGFGKPLRKSNFLRRAGSQPAPVPLRVGPSSVRQRPLQLLARSGTRSVFDGYIHNDVVRERAIAALQSISPTHLEDFGECPQKFLLKQLLGVRDLDDPEMQMQIDHREKGTVDHRILERFYKAMDETGLRDAMSALPMLPQSLLDTLDRIIDEEFELLEEKLPPFNAPVRNIEHQATRRVLRQFIALDLADLDAEDLMPRRFEEKFGPFVLEVGGTALKIEGKIDRIDEGTGRIRIVDYKSGKALRHVKLGDKIDRGVRLQLALYALAVDPRTEDRGPRTVSGAIKPIAGTGKLTEFSFELADKDARLRETLALFVAAIRRGDFPAFPNEKDADYNACKYCPVNHSCRTRHDADEKRSILHVSEPRALFEEPVA